MSEDKDIKKPENDESIENTARPDESSRQESLDPPVAKREGPKAEKPKRAVADPKSTVKRKNASTVKKASQSKSRTKTTAAKAEKAGVEEAKPKRKRTGTPSKTTAEKETSPAARPIEEAIPATSPKIKARSAEPPLRFSKENGFGFIIFDTPGKPVNIFNAQMLTALDQMLDELILNTDIKALLFISAKSGNFFAGADIELIKNLIDLEEGKRGAKIGQGIFNKIAALPYPTIAVPGSMPKESIMRSQTPALDRP